MNNFSKIYPHLTWWIENQGWVEIGSDDYMRNSLFRILDEGGMIWDDKNSNSIDEAMEKAESFLKSEIPDRFGFEIIPVESKESKKDFEKEIRTLNHEFELYIANKYSQRTAYKHFVIIDDLIDYLTFDHAIKDFSEIKKGIINSQFWNWHLQKIGHATKDEIKVAVKKFLKFLKDEKNIETVHLISKK